MTIHDGVAAATVISERLPRVFSAVVTLYAAFVAVFVPMKQFPTGMRNAPRSAIDVYVVIVAVALIWGCYRGWRLALRLDGQGVTVRNYFRTYHIGWSELSNLADGNAGLAIQGNFAWALTAVTRGRRPVVGSATTRYSGARPETLAVVRQHAELHGVAADVTGVARKLRPRRRHFLGDIFLWLGIVLAFFYPISLLSAATHCTTC
jgi:hypothetical protein